MKKNSMLFAILAIGLVSCTNKTKSTEETQPKDTTCVDVDSINNKVDSLEVVVKDNTTIEVPKELGLKK